MNLVTIGKIINTRGLQGEVKIASLTDFASLRYKKGNTLYLDESGHTPIVVKSYHHLKGFDYVQFQGYPSIASVEPLVNQFLYAEKTAIRLSKDSYFFADLEGCVIKNEQQITLGKVSKVEAYANRILLRMQRDQQPDVLIPFMAPFIVNVEITKKEIMVSLVEGML